MVFNKFIFSFIIILSRNPLQIFFSYSVGSGWYAVLRYSPSQLLLNPRIPFPSGLYKFSVLSHNYLTLNPPNLASVFLVFVVDGTRIVSPGFQSPGKRQAWPEASPHHRQAFPRLIFSLLLGQIISTLVF